MPCSNLQQRSVSVPHVTTYLLICVAVDSSQVSSGHLHSCPICCLLQVSLHRSDGLAAILELDHNLLITHAEDTAALILGAGVRQLYKKPLLK